MAQCKFIKRSHRKICAGDLDTEITLENRDIVPPLAGEVDFEEDFTNSVPVFSKVETTIGKTVFDGVNTDTVITHKITIRFDSTVTTETWILLNGNRINIVQTENLEQRNEWLFLLCTDRGATQASKA